MESKIKVLLVEDDLDFVFLTKKMIEEDENLEFSGYASNKATAVSLAKKLMPDIVLMDLYLTKSELDGIFAAKEIRLKTNAKVILLTSFEQPETIINASKKSFASGYVFKSQRQMLTDIIRNTATSHTPQAQFIMELILQELTVAERQVLKALLGEDIALKSKTKTIANQKIQIRNKLGLKNTQEVIHIFSFM